MSFSSSAKKELCDISYTDASQMKSQCYGMLLQGAFWEDNISLATEKKETAVCFAQLLAQLTGIYCDISNLNRKNLPSSQYVVRVPDREQRIDVMKYFNIHGKIQRIDPENINDEYASFVRGIFLASGTVCNPQKDYHLEIIVQNESLVGDMIHILESISLPPKIVLRSSQFVLYYKESGMIEDMLTLMGAVNASMNLMDVKIVKEVRNKVNRITNCETANIEKTVSASIRQIEAIKKIANGAGIDSLPDDLIEIARLRLENPEMSLSDLSKNLSEPISRSGVNHRLKRICEIAQKL